MKLMFRVDYIHHLTTQLAWVRQAVGFREYTEKLMVKHHMSFKISTRAHNKILAFFNQYQSPHSLAK